MGADIKRPETDKALQDFIASNSYNNILGIGGVKGLQLHKNFKQSGLNIYIINDLNQRCKRAILLNKKGFLARYENTTADAARLAARDYWLENYSDRLVDCTCSPFIYVANANSERKAGAKFHLVDEIKLKELIEKTQKQQKTKKDKKMTKIKFNKKELLAIISILTWADGKAPIDKKLFKGFQSASEKILKKSYKKLKK